LNEIPAASGFGVELPGPASQSQTREDPAQPRIAGAAIPDQVLSAVVALVAIEMAHLDVAGRTTQTADMGPAAVNLWLLSRFARSVMALAGLRQREEVENFR
jgi:hypothetical protein